MSSRNVRLSPEGKIKAGIIFETLTQLSLEVPDIGVKKALEHAIGRFQEVEEFKVEYLSVADVNTLRPVQESFSGQSLIGLVAVWLEGVRLIDNILFKG